MTGPAVHDADQSPLGEVQPILFAKAPDAGRTKTRLVGAEIDDDAAARLAEAMLRCTIQRLLDATDGALLIAVAPDDAAGSFAARFADGSDRVRCAPQGGGDLGERIERVWSTTAPDRPVALFGMDAPDVPGELLAAIASGLADADVAIGPTDDGGYWTLAARRFAPQLVRGVPWGGSEVYQVTCKAAEAAGLAVQSLPVWRDVDTPADLRALRRRLDAADDSDPALRRLAADLAAVSPPAQKDSTSPMTASAGSPPPASRSPEGSPHLDAEGLDLAEATVLLVDDNGQNLELMQAYLESLPCSIMVARDGLEAARLVDQTPPDLILLDVMMPKMSGFELCRKIKTNPGTRDIVIIMVTALHEVGDFERAVECGADDFLTKPVNKLELLTRVKSLVRVRLLKRQLEQVVARTGHSAPDERDHPEVGPGLE